MNKVEEVIVNPQLLNLLPKSSEILWRIFGNKIRLVGGSVRDLLLGKKVKDFDFACALPVSEIEAILHSYNIKTIPTGIKYGSLTALIGQDSFEITTLRLDKNQKGRDCEVEFVSDFASDAARRDFTINALYLDKEGTVFDYFTGLEDLAEKRVRFIGDPATRIAEDYLRILRFFRFSCEYGKNFDEEGFSACAAAQKNLSKLSKERIREELLKLIAGSDGEKIIFTLLNLENKGFFSEIFSCKFDLEGLKRFFLIQKLEEQDSKDHLLLSCLVGEWHRSEEAKECLVKFWQEICATNKEKAIFNKLQKILQEWQNFSAIDNKKYRDLAEKLSIFLSRIVVFYDQITAFDWLIYCFCKEKLFVKEKSDSLTLEEFEKLSKFVKNLTIPELPINGGDLANLGFAGKLIGEKLKQAKIFWTDSEFTASKPEIIEFLLNNPA